MIKKLLFAGGLVAVLTLALVAGGGTPARALPPPGPLQVFDLDLVQCLLPSFPDTVSPDVEGALPFACNAGEDKTAGGAVSQSTAIAIPAGDRLGYPYVYNGPGWQVQADNPLDYGNQVGDVTASVGLPYVMALGAGAAILGDASNCGGPPNNCGAPLTLATAVPAPYIEETTAWGPGTGCTGEDESYLTAAMPGASAMTPYVRYRSCIDTLFINNFGGAGSLRFPITPPTPLNLVTMTPNWSPAGTEVDLVLLSGAATSPTTSSVLNAIDSPQSSLSHTWAPYVASPAAPGLYARWATEISAQDVENGDLNFVLTTSCKTIGPAAVADADFDCQPDASEQPTTCSDSGWPTTPATTIAGNPDSDGDGLPDGIEVAWGSDPCKADTDNDGRTDLEEMVGPTQFLTDPTNADTDGDTVVDGGLTLDANGNGIPDCEDDNGDGTCDAALDTPTAAWTTNLDTSGDGSSHLRIGYKIVGTDVLPDNKNSIQFMRTAEGTVGDSANDVEITFTRDPANTTISTVKAGDGWKKLPDGSYDSNTHCKMTVGSQISSDATHETWRVDWKPGSPLCDVKKGDIIVINVFWGDTDTPPTLDGIKWTIDGNAAGDEGAMSLTIGGKDNCGSALNADQVNTDLDSATSWGNGDLYGDLCDTDDDQDGITDDAETTFQWDAGAHQCSNDIFLPGPATALDPLNPDSDGDGVIDGTECELGSNPFDAGDLPGGQGDDVDNDGVSSTFETYKKTQGFTLGAGQPATDVDVDSDHLAGQCTSSYNCGATDPDSDNDGLSDGCEIYVTGTNPLRADSDGNGTPDASEPNLTARIAAYCLSATDLDGDTVVNNADNCPLKGPAAQTNTNPTIGNGKGIAGDDSTVPWNVKNDSKGDACTGDLDNDSIPNATDAEPGGPGADITYDDGGATGPPPDGTWKGAGDDGPSWDILPLNGGNPGVGNGKLDGLETVCAGTFSDMPAGWANADTDNDGLKNSWEFCKWASSPNVVDSDGDGKGDCVEAADVDGNGVVSFTGDVIYYAKAILLPPATFGQDGDFDIDGNNTLSFTGDVIQEAKFGLIPGLCK
jgi:hypothetical protein